MRNWPGPRVSQWDSGRPCFRRLRCARSLPGLCVLLQDHNGGQSGDGRVDRLLIDEYWVGHTKAWIIPGTEDLHPYITASDKKKKWIMGTVGMAVIAAVLSGIMCMILR